MYSASLLVCYAPGAEQVLEWWKIFAPDEKNPGHASALYINDILGSELNDIWCVRK